MDSECGVQMVDEPGQTTRGTMMDRPLLVSSIAERAQSRFASRRVYGRTATVVESRSCGDLM